jgi:hypothetical protein
MGFMTGNGKIGKAGLSRRSLSAKAGSRHPPSSFRFAAAGQGNCRPGLQQEKLPNEPIWNLVAPSSQLIMNKTLEQHLHPK